MATSMTPIDLFTSLSDADKQKVLSALRKTELSPCERNGHKFKSVGVKEYWLWKPKIVMVCERCGQVKRI